MNDYTLAVTEVELARYRMMAEAARAEESDAWTRAGIVPGAVVGDVGCGPAAVAVVMADLVGDGGRVIGVERDPEALAMARRVVADAGSQNVELHQAEATATGIPPGSLDVAVMRHVLAHNGGREQALVDHLVSLVKPGGSVYVGPWGTSGADRRRAPRLVQHRADGARATAAGLGRARRHDCRRHHRRDRRSPLAGSVRAHRHR